MSLADVVIWGGTIVAPGVPSGSSLIIREGRIDEVRGPGGLPPHGRLVIDARERVVMAGVIDAHVHVDTPGPEEKALGCYSDTFKSLSCSAACGGVTTVMPFVFSSFEVPPERYMKECRSLAEAESCVDFGFHFGIVRDSDVDAVSALVAMGVSSFKAMMDYKGQGIMLDDRALLRAMDAVERAGGLMMVHAEDGEIIDHLETREQAAGRRDPLGYARARPPVAEWIAVLRALALAQVTGCRLYIVHLSTAEGLDAAWTAKGRGQRVFIETCPHYLLLTERELDRSRLGPLAKIGPPLRSEADNAALWNGLLGGAVDLVGSDHAPRSKAAKELGLTDIFAAPFGGPGVETLLPVLFAEFSRRDLPLELLSRLVSEAPARIFGLYPQKGAIRRGADADLVVIDPDASWTIEPERLHTRSDYSLWAGRVIRGKPVTTLVRGRPVLLDGEACGESGWGRFRPRQAGPT